MGGLSRYGGLLKHGKAVVRQLSSTLRHKKRLTL